MFILVSCGENQRSGNRVSKSQANDSSVSRKRIPKSVKFVDEGHVVDAMDKVNEPESIEVACSFDIDRIFEEACLEIDDFVEKNQNRTQSGFWWVSNSLQDRAYPEIRLSDSFGERFLCIERRPQPYNTTVVGYSVYHSKDGTYFAASSKFVNNEVVREDSTLISSTIEMRVALAPFYTRLYEAMWQNNKHSQEALSRLAKTS